MADHAVEGVDGLIGQHARQAEQHIPKERRYNAIAQVLGNRLDRRTRHTRLVETVRVAPDNMGCRRAPRLEVVFLQAKRHGPRGIVQAAIAQQSAGDERFHGPAAGEGAHAPGECPADACAQRHDKDRHTGTNPGRATVKTHIEGGDKMPNHHHRMRNPAIDWRRIANQPIQRQRQQQHQRRSRMREFGKTRRPHSASMKRAAGAVNAGVWS